MSCPEMMLWRRQGFRDTAFKARDGSIIVDSLSLLHGGGIYVRTALTFVFHLVGVLYIRTLAVEAAEMEISAHSTRSRTVASRCAFYLKVVW